SGPKCLFDIYGLTRTMNYQQVTAGNQTNPSAGFQDKFTAEKAGEEINQQYVLFLVWSFDSTNPQKNDGDAAFDGKEPVFYAKKLKSEVNVYPSSIAQSRKQDDKTKKEAKGKKLEDITHSNDENNVGAEAKFNNLETSITVSLISTTRVYKDHPASQIIGDLSSTTQTRSMPRVVKDQGGLSQMFNDDFHTSYASFMGFMVYQMDVKSAFIYGTIEEEVYVYQPSGFEDPVHLDKVYKVVKALYGLHQAPRAWYETLANYLLENGFQRGKIDQTLFIKRQKGDILLVQIYIIEGKSASTPIDTEKPLLKDPDGEDVDVHTYSLVRNVDSTTKFYMYPRFLQLIIRKQVDKNIEEVNTGDAAEGDISAAHGEVPTITEEPPIPSPTPPTPSPQPPQDIPSTSQRVKKLEMRNKVRVLKLKRLQKDDVVVLEDDKKEDREVADAVKDVEEAKVDESAQYQGKQAESQAEIYKIDRDYANKVLSMQKDETEPTEVQEVVDVVTTAKLITEVVTAASKTVAAASTIITTAEAQVYAATLTAAPARVADAPSRRRKGVDEAIDHVKRKAKKDPAVKRYQMLKRKSQTEAQARKNMIMYLKNVAGFKMDYFKEMSYYDICPIFEAKFNSNVAFLLKIKEQIEEDENRTLQKLNETPTERSAKKKKLDEDVEELRRHLQIVPNKDDDVYTKATPLTRKVPVVDYQIIKMNNKPYYKIIRVDDTHQLYINLEESKNYTWSSKGQRMEATGIMWCADHNFYIYSADFVSGEEVSAHNIHYRPDAKCVNHKPNVSRPQLKSNQSRDKVLPNNSQVKGNDLLTGNRGSNLYTISIQESTSSTSLCLMAKATPTQAWLWHRRLSHLNFDYINLLSKKDIVIGLPKLKYIKDQLCSSCKLSKAKRSSFKSKAVPSSKGRLNLLHMDLCGPMRVASINRKKYIMVIVDDYSRYT
nr:putative ribonuclease H-like domain-containing protein [Tanacetum cinerariifolium]